MSKEITKNGALANQDMFDPIASIVRTQLNGNQ